MTMLKKEVLLDRLDAIARSVERSGHGLALFALGSAGLEVGRLDEYSDLDFFVIVEDGHKQQYIENLDWLASIAPIVFEYRNTMDGHKILYQDGVFCEFAVFEKHELERIPFAPGRVIWKRSDIDDAIALPARDYSLPAGSTSTEWLLGEVLSNLYAGMCRFRRGEKLAAASLIQESAVAGLIDLYELSAGRAMKGRDPFSNKRRFEKRHVEFAALLPKFTQGYERSPQSANEILNYLSAHYTVNEAMRCAILELCISKLEK
jgi:hypothetical protein